MSNREKPISFHHIMAGSVDVFSRQAKVGRLEPMFIQGGYFSKARNQFLAQPESGFSIDPDFTCFVSINFMRHVWPWLDKFGDFKR